MTRATRDIGRPLTKVVPAPGKVWGVPISDELLRKDYHTIPRRTASAADSRPSHDRDTHRVAVRQHVSAPRCGCGTEHRIALCRLHRSSRLSGRFWGSHRRLTVWHRLR